jgi:predicted DCC family thiol-disulfide oxidoreductase YuxK
MISPLRVGVSSQRNALHYRKALYASTGRRTQTAIDNVLTNVILFDGVCNFCNTWVDILLRLDTQKRFRFCALQSPKGQELLQTIGKDANDISSVVLVKSLASKEAYFKSDAVLKVCEQLGLGFYMTSVLGSIIPPVIRNGMYDGVADNRYRILGKREACRCTDESLSDRFLS